MAGCTTKVGVRYDVHGSEPHDATVDARYSPQEIEYPEGVNEQDVDIWRSQEDQQSRNPQDWIRFGSGFSPFERVSFAIGVITNCPTQEFHESRVKTGDEPIAEPKFDQSIDDQDSSNWSTADWFIFGIFVPVLCCFLAYRVASVYFSWYYRLRPRRRYKSRVPSPEELFIREEEEHIGNPETLQVDHSESSKTRFPLARSTAIRSFRETEIGCRRCSKRVHSPDQSPSLSSTCCSSATLVEYTGSSPPPPQRKKLYMPQKKLPLRMFNANKLKVNLRSAYHRVQLQIAKKKTISQTSRRELATLLEKGKEESARIRVEHVIREDYFVEALEVVERYLELLLARFGLIESMSQCDPGISEAVHSIIWVSPRADIKELLIVRDQLTAKYGSAFAESASNDAYNYVNPRISKNLAIQTPDPKLVNSYLEEIAKTFNIDWEPKDDQPLIEYDHSFQHRMGQIRTDGAGNDYIDASTHLPASLFDDTLPVVPDPHRSTMYGTQPSIGSMRSASYDPSAMAQLQGAQHTPSPPMHHGPVQPIQPQQGYGMKMPTPFVDQGIPPEPYQQQPTYNPQMPIQQQPVINLTPPTPLSTATHGVDPHQNQVSVVTPKDETSFDALQERLNRLKQST